MIKLSRGPAYWRANPSPGWPGTASAGAARAAREARRVRSADVMANARACPHREPIPKGERAGCGQSHRCTAGRGDCPGGGTSVTNCWACSIAPRHRW